MDEFGELNTEVSDDEMLRDVDEDEANAGKGRYAQVAVPQRSEERSVYGAIQKLSSSFVKDSSSCACVLASSDDYEDDLYGDMGLPESELNSASFAVSEPAKTAEDTGAEKTGAADLATVADAPAAAEKRGAGEWRSWNLVQNFVPRSS